MFLKLFTEDVIIINELAWQEDSLKVFISVLGIPLTPKFMEDTFSSPTITAWHSTSFDHILTLPKLGKTKKTISAFSYSSRDTLTSVMTGIRTDAGFVAEIKGTLVLKSFEDVMSMPDAQGRRWIGFGMESLYNNGNNRKLSKFSRDMHTKLKDMLYPILVDQFENVNEDEKEFLLKYLNDLPNANNEGAVKSIQRILNALPKKSRGIVYKKYIDGAMKIVKRYSKGFMAAFFNNSSTTDYWDELLINQFTVEKVYYIGNSPEYYDDSYNRDLDDMVAELESKGFKTEDIDPDSFYKLMKSKEKIQLKA